MATQDTWKRIERKSVLDSPYMNVYIDTVQLPSGDIVDDYSIVDLPDGVVVVATDENDNLITIYEYKYAINQTILNLPSGGLVRGESVIEAGLKELLEETGYVSDDATLVKTLYEYPSKQSHVIHIVRVKNAHRITDVAHELTETISPVKLIAPTASSEDYEGEFNATYTVSALALTLPLFLRT